jgi:hypothetical protein
VVALCAGVLVVRRQRSLARSSNLTADPLLQAGVASMMPDGAYNEPGMFTPRSGAVYPGGGSPPGTPGMEYASFGGASSPPAGRGRAAAPIPFDPGLAEAMREAQVSLFAIPRPPVGEELEVQ